GPQGPELRARVRDLHGQSYGPCRIARAAAISRKQVPRLLEAGCCWSGSERGPPPRYSRRGPLLLPPRRHPTLRPAPVAGSEVSLAGGVSITQPSDDLPGFYSSAWDKNTCGEKPSPQRACLVPRCTHLPR